MSQALLRQAMEALEQCRDWLPSLASSKHSKIDAALSALSSALEAGEEPVATLSVERNEGGGTRYDVWLRDGMWSVTTPGEHPLYASPVTADTQGVEFDRDTDGELLIDWSPAKGRMVTLSLRADGRLAYAFHWDGEKAHGTAQMPAADTQGDAKDAARVLAEFAKTAPGRLPQRVQDAIAVALSATPEAGKK